MEKRDRERAAKAEIARLEAECKEIEREIQFGWADAEPVPSADVPSAKPIKQQPSFPTRTIAPANTRSIRVEELGAPLARPILADGELPHSRYGP
jgi:hypothetical protein